MPQLLLLLVLLALPGSLRAQEEPPTEVPLTPRGTAALVLKAGSIAGADRILLGGWAGLAFGDRFHLGGGGYALTKNVELAGSEADTGFELGMGYGGVLLQYQKPLGRRILAHGGMLLGAGHAQVRDQLMGREVGADNFGVLEPEVGLSVSLLPWLHLGLSGSRRFVWWVEDLPLVQSEDLRGTTGTLFLRVGGP